MSTEVVNLREAVRSSFRNWLGREPESEATIDTFAALGSSDAIDKAVATSPEAQIKRRSADHEALFMNYASTFDAEQTIRRHSRSGLVSDPRYLINFIGTKIEERFYPGILIGKAGSVEPVPIPANWHADVAEWAAVLRAVDFATGTFAVAELGCGPGCWINNAGVAARNAGLIPTLIGVEGDEGHIAFAKSACDANGFCSEQITLYHGVAAAKSGFALFPRQRSAGEKYGLEPIFNATEADRKEAKRSGEFDELPMIPLSEVIGNRDRLDLLHVDIQGGEADLVEGGGDVLSSRVAYMFVGTHSRVIEGRVASALLKGPWRLEIERPAIVNLTENGPVTHIDGVQGWRNMALLPD